MGPEFIAMVVILSLVCLYPCASARLTVYLLRAAFAMKYPTKITFSFSPRPKLATVPSSSLGHAEGILDIAAKLGEYLPPFRTLSQA